MDREAAFNTLLDAFAALSPEQRANLLDAAMSGKRIACGKYAGEFVMARDYG